MVSFVLKVKWYTFSKKMNCEGLDQQKEYKLILTHLFNSINSNNKYNQFQRFYFEHKNQILIILAWNLFLKNQQLKR
jgi:hypothetical protein